jgi:cyanophycinase
VKGAGPLALVGGDELNPGNEEQDRILVAAAAGGPAYVVATAAGRQRPDVAVANAKRWFAGLGLEVDELPATARAHVADPDVVRRADAGRFFYLVGGDPGLVPKTLAGTKLWAAIVGAWRAGAALAGSSAGAMAFGEWTLTRDRMPGDAVRRYTPALSLLPRIAVLPHFDTFGHRWAETALQEPPIPDVVLLGIEERTAAVFIDGGWWVRGAGGVTVIKAADRRAFAAGARIRGLPVPDGRG